MKIRLGFVSNSSSSSFIITTANKKKLKTKITIEVDFNKFIDKSFNNKKDFIGHIKECYGLEEKEMLEDSDYIKVIKAIENGETAYIGEVASDNENPLETYLYENGLPDKIDGVTIIINDL
jgi:hypothetical protein